MSTDPFEQGSGSGIKTLSFTNKDETTGVMTPKPAGTTLGGKTTGSAKLVQAYDFDSNKPLWWPREGGKPTTQAPTEPTDKDEVKDFVIPILADDGTVTQFRARASRGKKDSDVVTMFSAIEKARKAAGSPIADGGDLRVTLTRVAPNPKGGQPSKSFEAVYKVPDVFEVVPTPPAPAAAVPAPPSPAPQAVPAPPAPASVATTPEGFTLEQLVANGWTKEQALNAFPVLGSIPAQPAPPAPPVVDAKAAALAALSPEDRQLLGL